MSAYIVSPDTINAVLTAALAAGSLPSRQPAWTAGGPGSGWATLTPATAAEVARLLYNENVRSVAHRYNETGHYFDAGSYPWERLPGTPDVVVALKLLDVYEYQACEAPGHETSEAARIVAALRRTLICSLPGYDDTPFTDCHRDVFLTPART